MNLPDSIAIQKYHNDRILKFGGDSSRALGWTTSESQQIRFSIILELLGDLNHQSVLDVGCGHGDLRGFIGASFDDFTYAGIDQVERFLDVAIERYGKYANTAFYAGDFFKADIPVCDFCVACGALSYVSNEPDFIFKIITKLFRNCKRGLVFNLLKQIDSKEQILTGYPSEQILAHCKTLSNHIVYRDGYCGEDYTIAIYHL